MKTQIKEKLMIDIETGPDLDHVYSGKCLIENSEIVVIMNFNEESCEFDGFTILKSKDVTAYRAWEKEEYQEIKNDNAVEELKKINLEKFSDFKSTLKYLSGELIAILAYGDTESYFVGKILKLNNIEVELQIINTESQWTSTETIKYNDISYVGFGTKYEQKLKNDSKDIDNSNTISDPNGMH